ncbi:methionyl-tRNA formyltransferase [Patescibacteria group bacterium]|nr:methionyl-tRNA formyltransferase [Patescibacteria group bacterium]
MNEIKKYKTVIMGTPEFAVKPFSALISNPNFEVVLAVSQPDKKVGRKQIIKTTPVKKLAQENNIEVAQPEKIKDIEDKLKDLNADILIVIAYGKILPQRILDIFKYGAINVHGSLLPKYRGSSCMQAAILNGDKETGVTIMLMDAGMDTGDILKQFKISIDDKETISTLHDKLSDLSAKVLPNTLREYLKENIKAQKQDEEKASTVKMLSKEDGHLDFKSSADYIDRQIRALNPWPSTFAKLDSEYLKILETGSIITTDQPHEIGELFFNNNSLFVQTKDKAIEITRLQVSGKKPANKENIISGYKHLEGKVLQ